MHQPKMMDRHLSYWLALTVVGLVLGLAIALVLIALWLATQSLR